MAMKVKHPLKGLNRKGVQPSNLHQISYSNLTGNLLHHCHKTNFYKKAAINQDSLTSSGIIAANLKKKTLQANTDTDQLIVATALNTARVTADPVIVVGNDTDLTVMLLASPLHYARDNPSEYL